MINLDSDELEYDKVYRPNDDTYFLLDVLFLEAQFLKKNKNISQIEKVVEIGCGTGYVINHFLQFLQKFNIQVKSAVGSDINQDAVQFSQGVTNFMKNQEVLKIQKKSILEGVNKKEKQESMQIFICNPPYVPTESEELVKFKDLIKKKDIFIQKNDEKNAEKISGIDVSYAGGVDGMEVTYQIIDQVQEYMSGDDVFYFFMKFILFITC
ncbi:hypothetical protein PPERSA_02693 [Pseudocohnilembus persalinus]|uniref:Methyltransferase small domain-containing protein n=1 Tax=Pseudocohnilembus persalinus TaxID=266149 RepID=A0A0V0R5N8_PSEPJ|nr:hypothetical protein PPERSA_02693 [Pseudocohnilembus persalinus]|eukprot:KRX09821.1 hypothetical protein PPERSA_02693 [Pseudocohnilembus persalinus]